MEKHVNAACRLNPQLICSRQQPSGQPCATAATLHSPGEEQRGETALHGMGNTMGDIGFV